MFRVYKQTVLTLGTLEILLRISCGSAFPYAKRYCGSLLRAYACKLVTIGA